MILALLAALAATYIVSYSCSLMPPTKVVPITITLTTVVSKVTSSVITISSILTKVLTLTVTQTIFTTKLQTLYVTNTIREMYTTTTILREHTVRVITTTSEVTTTLFMTVTLTKTVTLKTCPFTKVITVGKLAKLELLLREPETIVCIGDLRVEAFIGRNLTFATISVSTVSYSVIAGFWKSIMCGGSGVITRGFITIYLINLADKPATITILTREIK